MSDRRRFLMSAALTVAIGGIIGALDPVQSWTAPDYLHYAYLYAAQAFFWAMLR